MANKFVSFLETAGKDIEKGLSFVVSEAPNVTALAGLLFPAQVAEITGVVTAVKLIQNAVLSVEQKFSAVAGSGVTKAAEVLTLVGDAVVSLLTQAGISTADTAYVTKLVNAVVAILNAKAAA